MRALSLSTPPAITTIPSMSRKFFSLYFFVTWVALTTASGLFLLESFRVVVSTAEIVILPRTETAIVAAGNAVALVRSESFALRVAAGTDAALGEDTWSESVAAELQPGSSTLSLAIKRESRGEAELLMGRLTKELGAVLSQWYAIPKELDLRVIDGPRITHTVSSWPLFLGASLLLGFGVTFGFFLLLSLIDRSLRHSATAKRQSGVSVFPPETFRPSPAVPYWSDGFAAKEEIAPAQTALPNPSDSAIAIAQPDASSQPAAADALPATGYTSLLDGQYGPETVALESVFEEDESLETEREEERGSRRPIATGPAPDNLPIMEALSPLAGAEARLVAADINETARVQSAAAEAALVETIVGVPPVSAPAVPRTGEPTQEDYKRRLNELLSGKM